ncbi:hypothetical protein UPYG_G00335590 [Umbra pygmaea]|uniref:Protein TOPAZ1 n=1 Tax=Umbra pygmaea TaxID=75934 RepID=A0ABD0VXB2_UMBPY
MHLYLALKKEVITDCSSPPPDVYRRPIVKHSHPKPSISLQACPQRPFGREIKSSCCALCGDIKYTTAKTSKLSRVGSVGVTDGSRASILCRRTGPKVRVKTWMTFTSTIKPPKKLVIWIGRYPKVKLCDVGQACNGLIGNISCFLPAWLLTTKVVHCFKRDYWKSVRQLGPSCSSRGGHGSKTARERLARKKSGHCSQFTSQQCTDTGEHGFADLSTNRSACLFTSEGGISEASNNSFASFSLGKQLMSKGESGAGIRDGDILEGTGSNVIGSESVAVVTETPVAKKRRLGVVGDLTKQHQLLSRNEPALHSGIDTVPTRDCEAESEVQCDVSIIFSNASESPVRSHHLGVQDDDQGVRSRGNGRSEVSLLSTSPEENGGGDDSGMCSCRRVIPYERLEVSCTRTYVTWPFPKSDSALLPSVTSSVHDANGTLTPPVESGSLSCSGNGALVSGDEHSFGSAERNTVLSSNATLSETSSQTDRLPKKPQPRCRSRGLLCNNASTSAPPKLVISTCSPNVSESEGASVSSSFSPADKDIDLSFSLSKSDSVSTYSLLEGCSENNTTLSSTPSLDSDVPPSLIGFINGKDVTPSSLQYINKKDEAESYVVRDQRENLSSAVFMQALPCPTDDDDGAGGVYTVNGTCANEEGHCPGDKGHKTVQTQTCADDEFNKNQSTFREIKFVNKEGSTQSLFKPPIQNQVEVMEGGKVKPARDPKADRLDEFTAYEQDILVVEAMDDPELFGSMPQEIDLRGVSTRRLRALKARSSVRAGTALRSARPALATEKSPTTCTDGLAGSTTDPRRIVPVKVENNVAASVRPVLRPIPALFHSHSLPLVDHVVLVNKGGTDCNNNYDSNVKQDNSESYRGLGLQSMSSMPSLPSGDSWSQGRKAPPAAEIVPQQLQKLQKRYNDTYCKFYFNISGCFHKMCWFLHVPKKGDEKFCVDVVMRFIKSCRPACLQRAASVFTSYYQSSPPGIHYTPLVLNSLLTSLLNIGFLSDVKTVLHVSSAHNLLPHLELLLAVFDSFREKDQSALTELIQLTSKVPPRPPIDSAGNYTPNPENHRLSARPETQSLIHAFIDVECCTIQEDWARLGMVFCSVCQSHRCLVELQHFSCRVAKALLRDAKDKLALPFASFAETVYQELVVWEDVLMRSFLGRIGVSLMCRYHQTQQWSKGQRLVEVLSRLKVNYSTLKGLFSNQDEDSRCHLITIATELFLGSDSVEGALNTLRDNKWFLSSCGWPCSMEDVTERRKVLVRLAEKTSHRDTLEVLINLPGLKEPTELADVSMYECLFNSHLKSCVDRRTLCLAADMLDYMFSKNLAVDPSLIHALLHKLGKQNNWLRARAVFKQALSLGYYAGVKAVPGSLALTVPSSLGEIEMALALEMAMTLNATTILNAQHTPEPIVITLKRTIDSETEYLAAGSRLLSVAIVPNPKLAVHYTAVNSCREQLFTVDTHTAHRWLRHNHTWANAVWAEGSSTFQDC